MGYLLTKLAESQLQLHTIIEAAPECIKLLSEDGRLLQMNQAGLVMLEVDDPKQVLGHHVHNIVLPAYRRPLQDLVKRVFKGESGDLEFEIQGIKGTHRVLYSHIVPLRNPKGDIVAALSLTRDVTEKKLAEEALRMAHEHSDLLLNSMAEGVYGVDTNGNCTFVNSSFLKILGYADVNEIIGKHIHEMIHHTRPDGSHYPAEECRMYQAYLLGEEINVSDEVFWHKDGTPIPVEYWSHPLLNNDKIIGAIATFVDISDRKAAERQIRHLAYYDVLTQLPNRRLLTDRLEQAMVTSHRTQRFVALMFLDLDNFKPLNDKYGHDVGDLLLIEVANRISNCTRQMDTVARFGGDEFIVMIRELDTDHATSKMQAQIVAEKVRTALSESYTLKLQIDNDQTTEIQHHCTASIGVVLFADRDNTQEDILKWADIAMYRAKMNGGNNVQFNDDYL
jgi:diguanylate cyclase (GGDEF)-like protein/PAS domain S-box-containing protein